MKNLERLGLATTERLSVGRFGNNRSLRLLNHRIVYILSGLVAKTSLHVHRSIQERRSKTPFPHPSFWAIYSNIWLDKGEKEIHPLPPYLKKSNDSHTRSHPLPFPPHITFMEFHFSTANTLVKHVSPHSLPLALEPSPFLSILPSGQFISFHSPSPFIKNRK